MPQCRMVKVQRRRTLFGMNSTSNWHVFAFVLCGVNILGVSRITEVTIREQMMRMTSRAMAIPFQFLCGGALPTRSW